MDNSYKNLTSEYRDKGSGYYEQPRPEMLKFISDDAKKILDVGCSSGAFGELIKKNRQGCAVWGIEPEPAMAAIASGRLDRVINDVFSNELVELEGEMFDCIVFNDVLEHVPNPGELLRQCKANLMPGGTAVASIPNILHFYEITNILTTQDWKYRSEGILDNTHLRFFTKKSIIRLFETAGFEIESIQGINPSFGLKYKIANALTLGRISDWRFVQFGVAARCQT